MHPVTVSGAGFLFDMDGTLVDSTAVVEAIWTEFAEKHGIDPLAVIDYSHGRQTVDTLTRFLPHRTAAERDLIADALAAHELNEVGDIAEVAGAAALLTALIEAGAPVAVVTSAPRDLAVARMGVAGVPVPDVLVGAEDATRAKPAPDGYLRAAQLLGVPATECVAFEDAGPGLRAALAAGATTVVVGGHRSEITTGLVRFPDHSGVTVTRSGDRFRLTVRPPDTGRS
jgi:sugar-phosphatase